MHEREDVADVIGGMLDVCLANGWIKKDGQWHKLRDLVAAGFTVSECYAMHEGDDARS